MADLRARKTLASARTSTGFRLLRAGRLFERRFAQRIREAIPDEDRFPYLSLFPHIDRDGTRISEVAARMGVSKQAASKLIQQAEGRGQLEVVPDPSDGRAKIVRFTEEGMALFGVGDRLVNGIQREFRAILGERELALLDALLDALIAASQEEEKDE
jgi:DNA-binding MarR family transcriptional regulator